MKIKIIKNGPLEVSGDIPLDRIVIETDKKGFPLRYKKIKEYPLKKNYFLCRCGNSKTKPFCDGFHVKTNFDGTQNAMMNKYSERADLIESNNLLLKDDISLCSGAGFCRGKGGDTWNLIKSNNNEKEKIAIQQCFNCSSGRLTIFNKKTNSSIEQDFKPHISILYEPWKKVGGPIWVKGKIPIENENKEFFEIRNRVTLCRCGRSANKPFCDASHRFTGFLDEESNKD